MTEHITTTWNNPDTAPNGKTVAIVYSDIHGRHVSRARRPKGASSWHNPHTGVEITQGRFLTGWLTISEASKAGVFAQ